MKKEDIPAIVGLMLLAYLIGAITGVTANSPSTWTEFPSAEKMTCQN